MTEIKNETMTAQNFAAFIGLKIGTVYKWKCLKKLPKNIYRKIGNRKLIFLKAEVDQWIQAGAQLNNTNNNERI